MQFLLQQLQPKPAAGKGPKHGAEISRRVPQLLIIRPPGGCPTFDKRIRSSSAQSRGVRDTTTPCSGRSAHAPAKPRLASAAVRRRGFRRRASRTRVRGACSPCAGSCRGSRPRRGWSCPLATQLSTSFSRGVRAVATCGWPGPSAAASSLGAAGGCKPQRFAQAGLAHAACHQAAAVGQRQLGQVACSHAVVSATSASCSQRCAGDARPHDPRASTTSTPRPPTSCLARQAHRASVAHVRGQPGQHLGGARADDDIVTAGLEAAHDVFGGPVMKITGTCAHSGAP